jgi:purine-nucleoside phosphorylase
VTEAIVARHAGLKVLGLSLVTNFGCGLDAAPLAHAHTLAAAHAAGDTAARLLQAVLAALPLPGADAR